VRARSIRALGLSVIRCKEIAVCIYSQAKLGGVMNIKCLFGHKWNGCKCNRCGVKRDEAHTWDGCHCVVCYKLRDEAHSWDRCRCTVCYEVRDIDHTWSKGECAVCGRRRKTKKHTIEMNIAPLPVGADPYFVDTLTCPGCDKAHTLEWESSGAQPNHEVIRSHCRECGDEVHIIIPGGLLGRLGRL
jgi:hypothetical protein